jgi:hypothetical protein
VSRKRQFFGGCWHTLSRGNQYLPLKALPGPNRWNTLIAPTSLVGTDDWKQKRDELKAKRNSLFNEYLKRPHDFHLASAIKPMDDEIAVCTEKLNQEQRSARSNAT